MANTKSAAKRARQNVRRTLINKRALTSIKLQLKKTRAEIAGKKKESAKEEVRKISSALDKAVKSGKLHRNVANRQKSKLARHLAAVS